jgi:hypothetical protein
MNNYVLERISNEVVVAYLDICLEDHRKTTRNYSQNNRCTGRNSKQEPPDYKSRVLPLNQPVPSCIINEFCIMGIANLLVIPGA